MRLEPFKSSFFGVKTKAQMYQVNSSSPLRDCSAMAPCRQSKAVAHTGTPPMLRYRFCSAE